MGIDILHLGPGNTEMASQIERNDLAQLAFHHYRLPSHNMSSWMMNLTPGKELFPWWQSRGEVTEEDVSLRESWGITHPQQLFDLMFLNQLRQLGGKNLYFILPGSIKQNGWDHLHDEDRSTFLQGQSCKYHLEGSYSTKMNINWVPYYQPQSVVKNLSLGSLWRLFMARPNPQDNVNCLSFFSLSNPARLPAVMNLLIHEDTNRSRKITSLVDWFGVYSSPIKNWFSTTGVIYANHPLNFIKTEDRIFNHFSQAKKDLSENPIPFTTLRILNRHMPL